MASLLRQWKNNGKFWPKDIKFLVIIHQYDRDVSWAKELKFPHIIYEKDKPEMKPYFGQMEDYGDFTQGRKACAQWVVSRDNIRSRPCSFYENMYIWLVTNTLDQGHVDFDPVSKERKGTSIDKDSRSNWFTSRY